MKKLIKLAILSSIFGTTSAQNHVSNIRVQQADDQLIVMYDLAERADIEAYVSFDGGATYQGPLQHVSGAVGKDIAPERNKMFMWDIVKEVGYVDYQNVVIKITATPLTDDVPVVPAVEKKVVDRYPPFLVAVSFGARPYGTTSFGKVNNGVTGVIDLDLAYFFNPWVGAGIKANAGISDVAAYGEGANLYYTDWVVFLGPALYARLGNRKLALTACVGAGAVNWNMPVKNGTVILMDNGNVTEAGVFLSAGVNCMLTRHFGIGLNVHTLVTDFVGRKPDGAGGTLGLNFRF